MLWTIKELHADGKGGGMEAMSPTPRAHSSQGTTTRAFIVRNHNPHLIPFLLTCGEEKH